MKVTVYEHLWAINAAFDRICQSLDSLKEHRQFHPAELARLARLSKENRASLTSYLAAVIESVETTEAGRRFKQRLARERNDEIGR